MFSNTFSCYDVLHSTGNVRYSPTNCGVFLYVLYILQDMLKARWRNGMLLLSKASVGHQNRSRHFTNTLQQGPNCQRNAYDPKNASTKADLKTLNMSSNLRFRGAALVRPRNSYTVMHSARHKATGAAPVSDLGILDSLGYSTPHHWSTLHIKGMLLGGSGQDLLSWSRATLPDHVCWPFQNASDICTLMSN